MIFSENRFPPSDQVRGHAFPDHALKGPGVPDNDRFSSRLKLELAYFSGYARLNQWRTGGAGVILRFERVRPRQAGRFQPLKSREITPAHLDRLVRALKRWKYDIVSMDEVCRRASQPRAGRRFVCLTFDGGYRDITAFAYPVLSRHQAPFTVYLATAFPDGLGEPWWLALEQVIAQHGRISLVMDRTERHFEVQGVAEKMQLYTFLDGWMRKLAPGDLVVAINDLCKRYSVDLAALSRSHFMSWEELVGLAQDPLATIASATVNYPILANLKDAAVLREMTMGRAVATAALGRDSPHFAYPFGNRASFGRQHPLLAAEAGFASAVTAIPGVVWPKERSNLHALPRIGWDGQRRSLRILRVLLTGMNP
jgi:peptidoglycan/xylan/chitin deacetylase (PgdA/CDA1 family)